MSSSSNLRLNKILSQLTPSITTNSHSNQCNATNNLFDTAGKPIICKAAVAFKKWDEKDPEPLSIQEVEVAVPKDNEVRIKLLYTGVCASDWHCLTGRTYGKCPIVLGHEGCGIVESVGNKVKTVQAGDAVIPVWMAQCNQCKMCLSGQTNICDSSLFSHAMPDKTTRIKLCSNSEKTYQFLGTGTFSQYTVVPEYCVAKINQTVIANDLGAEACLLGCGVTTGIESVRNVMKVKRGSTAAVFGLGGIGLSVVQGCKMEGCSRIIGVDINPNKFALAKQMGCTDCLNPLDYPNKKIEKVIASKTGGGVDYSFECIGLPQTMTSALESTHKGWGKACIVGLAPDHAQVKAEAFSILSGRLWTGALFGGVKSRDGVPKIVNEYLDGKIDLTPLVTDVLPFSRINEGFVFMQQKTEGKLRTVVDLWK